MKRQVAFEGFEIHFEFDQSVVFLAEHIMIWPAYANACLAPGEAQAGRRGDKQFDMYFYSNGFRDHVAETQKQMTCVMFGGQRRVQIDELQQGAGCQNTLDAHM